MNGNLWWSQCSLLGEDIRMTQKLKISCIFESASADKILMIPIGSIRTNIPINPINPPILFPDISPRSGYNVVFPDRIVDGQSEQLRIISYFRQQIRQSCQNCLQASKFYNICFYILFAVIAILSLATSILAFIVASGTLSTSTNTWICFAIGIIGILINFGHATLNFKQFDTKKYSFKNLKILYAKLDNKLNYATDYEILDRPTLAKTLEDEVQNISANQHFQYPFEHHLNNHIETFPV